MPRIQFKQVDQIRRKLVSDAFTEFLRHCKLKNLSPYTHHYYQENIKYFLEALPEVKYVDEITQETTDSYVAQMMEKGNKVTAINARLRAIFVFMRYCFEQEFTEEFSLSQIKEDETFKEPYTEAELKKLLRQPQSDKWTEWREWAAINLLVATGVRASTVVNMKISDLDFEHNIIRLRKLKNRRQQTLPMSSSLKEALEL